MEKRFVFCPECGEWWGVPKTWDSFAIIHPCPKPGCGTDWSWTGLPEHYTAVRNLYPGLEMEQPEHYELGHLQWMFLKVFSIVGVRLG